MAGRDDRQNRRAASFRVHLSVYLTFGLVFLVLNLLTSPGDWWFYWPMFGWGIAVVVHAFIVFGADAPFELLAILRSWADRVAPSPPPSPPVPPTPGVRPAEPATTRGTAAAPTTVDEAEARIARLWRTARLIPTEGARERAFRVCAAADRVAEVMATDKADPQLVGWFVDRYLTPTEALLERYARLARRGVTAAEPTLAKVEEHDLPLLESRLDALYEQLHRGDVIDLAVASEMLEFDDRPPKPLRSSST